MSLIVGYYNIFLFGLLSISTDPGKDFLHMEGELLTHHPDAGVTIYELRAENGLIKWYGQEVSTEVCMSKQCRMINIWLFWKESGNYLGFQLEEGEQLTKRDHEPFTRNDYDRLHQLLGDPDSYFKHLKFEDLVSEKDTFRLVDGYSGATQPHLSTYSIDGAVYTCYTLWWIVHGPASKQIRALFARRLDDRYLQRLFETNDKACLEEAIKLMDAYPSFQLRFSGEICEIIKSSGEEFALEALRTINTDLLADKKFQQQLVENIQDASPYMRAEIIWKLSGAKVVDTRVVSELLSAFRRGELEVNELRLIYSMISRDMISDARILQHVTALKQHENAYIRRISHALLTKLVH